MSNKSHSGGLALNSCSDLIQGGQRLATQIRIAESQECENSHSKVQNLAALTFCYHEILIASRVFHS